MATDEPKALGAILGAGGGTLSGLRDRAAAMDALTCAIAESLPYPLGSHITVASVRDDRLIVAADSAAWASRLRFYAKEMLDCLGRQGLPPAATVTVTVRPAFSEHPIYPNPGRQ